MHEIVFPRQFHRQLKDLYDRGNAEAEGPKLISERQVQMVRSDFFGVKVFDAFKPI